MLFADSHEWVRVEDGVGYVGISRHAQQELGEIVFVSLPPVGKVVKAGEEVAILESTKAAADLYAPVSGEVIAVNAAVQNTPQIINTSPEQEGWLFQLSLSNPRELDNLLTTAQYQDLVNES